MFTEIEALGFRCLRHVRQPLGPFHVLAGPNGSGKSAFLDVVALLGAMVSDGLEAAIAERARAFDDLVWMRCGAGFELAIEAAIPAGRRRAPGGADYDRVRYEAALSTDSGGPAILTEKVLVKAPPPPGQQPLFSDTTEPPATILTPRTAKGARTVIHKVPGGNDNFYAETGNGWDHAFRLGPRKSALANLPEDETAFPVATWLKGLLAGGVRRLDPEPGLSTLPGAVETLRARQPERFREWIAGLRAALPDLEDIRGGPHGLALRYITGLEIPSRMASAGTLRLLALTLPAYFPGSSGVYLADAPENGLDPRAVECAARSLASIPGVQILAATHSPAFLAGVAPENILCFSKTPEGATVVTPGRAS